MAVDLDTLQITIAADSTDAAEKVDALSDSLERLRKVIKGDFSSVSKKIRHIGKAAKEALKKSTAKGGKSEKRSASKESAKEDKSQRTGGVFSSLSDRIRRIRGQSGIDASSPEIQSAVDLLQEYKRQQDEARKSANALANALSKIKQNTEKISVKKIWDYADAMQEASKAADSFAQVKLASGKSYEKPQAIDSGVTPIEGVTAEVDMGGAGGRIKQISEDIGNFISKTFTAKTAMDALKSSVASSNPAWSTFSSVAAPAVDAVGKSLASAASMSPRLKIALIAVAGTFAAVRQAANASKDVLKTTFSGARKAALLFRDALFRVLSALKDIAKKGASQVLSSFKNFGASIKNAVVGPFERAAKSAKDFISTIGRMSVYWAIGAALRTITEAIQEGKDNLYQYSLIMRTQFAPAMDSLATSALYLRNSLAAMAAPLIEALAPAIDFVVDKLANLFNMIGMVFAALTGKNVYTKARKSAVSYGKAADEAAEKTQEFKRYLIGIDELNIFDQAEESAGAGADIPDYGSMFEEVKIPSDIADWAKEIRDAIARGDWYGAGKILAEKLNEIVDAWDAEAWGKALGEKINHALYFANGFLENFDFYNLGHKLADFMNGLFLEVDFPALGKFLANGLNGIASLLRGFFENAKWDMYGRKISTAINSFFDGVDWKGLADTLSSGINGIFTMLDEIVTNTRWGSIGRHISTFINEFFDTVDWIKIGKTLADGINGVFQTFWQAAYSLDWQQIGLDISNSINSFFSTVNWDFLRLSLTTGLSGIFQTLNAFLKLTDWKTIFSELSETIVAGINSMIDGLTLLLSDESFWSEFSTSLGTGIGNIITGIKWGDLFNDAVDLIIIGLNTAITSVSVIARDEEFWANLREGVISGARSIVENKEKWMELFENLPVILGEALNVAVAGLNELTADPSFWTDLGTSLGDGINKMFEDFDVENAITSLGDLVLGILTTISAALETANWDEIKESISNGLNNVDWDGILDAVRDIVGELFWLKVKLGIEKFKLDATILLSSVGTVFLEIGGSIVEGILQGILNGITGIGSWLKENVVDPIVNGLKDLFGIHSPSTVTAEIGDNLIAGLYKGIEEGWQSIIEFFSTAVDNLTTSLATSLEGIKTTFSDAWDGIKTVFSDVESFFQTAFSGAWQAINDAWSGAVTFFTDTWNDIKGALADVSEWFGTKFTDAWNAVSEAWNGAKDFFTDIWNGIKETFSDVANWFGEKFSSAWDNIKNAFSGVGEFFGGVYDEIKGAFTDLINDASDWGGDICSNIAKGISGGIKTVKGAVTDIAEGIKDFIGFSEPKDGPLSNFHTYMPDMLSLMASGIKDNADIAVNEVSKLAAGMKKAMPDMDMNMNIGEPNLPVLTSAELSARYTPRYQAGTVSSAETPNYTTQQRESADSIMNIVFAASQQIVEAINNQASKPIYLNGYNVSTQTTSVQNRQNMMYGKSLQNT